MSVYVLDVVLVVFEEVDKPIVDSVGPLCRGGQVEPSCAVESSDELYQMPC